MLITSLFNQIWWLSSFFMTWLTSVWLVGQHRILSYFWTTFNLLTSHRLSPIFAWPYSVYWLRSSPSPFHVPDLMHKELSLKNSAPPFFSPPPHYFFATPPCPTAPHPSPLFFFSPSLCSLQNLSSLSLCEECWGGAVGGRPSQAGLFVPTCTCRESGGMSQAGYSILSTTIYTQTHPEHNTILPGSMLGWGEVRGADGNENKDKGGEQPKTERCRRNNKVMP